MCTTLLICFSNHAFLICFKYKCHIINRILLTSLLIGIYREISDLCLFYKPPPANFSQQTSLSVNKKFLLPNAKSTQRNIGPRSFLYRPSIRRRRARFLCTYRIFFWGGVKMIKVAGFNIIFFQNEEN